MSSAVVSGRGLPSAVANASRDGEGVPLACPGVGDSKERSWNEQDPNYPNFADYDRLMIELCTNEDFQVGSGHLGLPRMLHSQNHRLARSYHFARC